MATVYGVNKTKYNTPVGSNIVDQGINKGNVCFMQDSYEAAAAASGTIIEVCDKLPTGAIVTSVVVAFDDLGTGVTLDIGDGNAADRYGDGIDAASAAAVHAYPIIAEIATMGEAVGEDDDDQQIQITVGGSAATGTIKIQVEYSI